jgi:hypothetical protein
MRTDHLDGMASRVLEAAGQFPGVVTAVGGVVPLPTFYSIKGLGMSVHCLCREPAGLSRTEELVSWLRQQACAIMAVVHAQRLDKAVTVIGLTLRLQGRGNNHIVYACEMSVNQLRSKGTRVLPSMLINEFSHDDVIQGVLPPKAHP